MAGSTRRVIQVTWGATVRSTYGTPAAGTRTATCSSALPRARCPAPLVGTARWWRSPRGVRVSTAGDRLDVDREHVAHLGVAELVEPGWGWGEGEEVVRDAHIVDEGADVEGVELRLEEGEDGGRASASAAAQRCRLGGTLTERERGQSRGSCQAVGDAKRQLVRVELAESGGESGEAHGGGGVRRYTQGGAERAEGAPAALARQLEAHRLADAVSGARHHGPLAVLLGQLGPAREERLVEHVEQRQRVVSQHRGAEVGRGHPEHIGHHRSPLPPVHSAWRSRMPPREGSGRQRTASCGPVLSVQ
eukprot:scaffold39007_cov58-Phaeocystis_antarctica.AAC.3